jgi:hypothetical protein
VQNPSKGTKQLAQNTNILSVQAKDSSYLLARKQATFTTKHLDDASFYKKIDLRVSFSKNHPGMCIEDLARRCLDGVLLDSYSLAKYTTELIGGGVSHTALVGFIGAVALIQTKSTSAGQTAGLFRPRFALTSDTPVFIRELVFATGVPPQALGEPNPAHNGLFDVVDPFLKAGLLEPRGFITHHNYSGLLAKASTLRIGRDRPLIETLYDRGFITGSFPPGLEFFLKLPLEVQQQVVDYIRIQAFQASSIANTLDIAVINSQLCHLFL